MLPDYDDPNVWLSFAQKDARAARVILAADETLTEAAGFHIQQAIEKALKAVVVAKKLPMPFTHNISHLVAHLQPEPTLDRLRAKLSVTTDYAMRFNFVIPER